MGRVYFGCNKNKRAFSSSKSQSNTITKKSPLFQRQPISRSPLLGSSLLKFSCYLDEKGRKRHKKKVWSWCSFQCFGFCFCPEWAFSWWIANGVVYFMVIIPRLMWKKDLSICFCVKWIFCVKTANGLVPVLPKWAFPWQLANGLILKTHDRWWEICSLFLVFFSILNNQISNWLLFTILMGKQRF